MLGSNTDVFTAWNGSGQWGEEECVYTSEAAQRGLTT